MPIWHIDSDSIPVKGCETRLRRKFHVTANALLDSMLMVVGGRFITHGVWPMLGKRVRQRVSPVADSHLGSHGALVQIIKTMSQGCSPLLNSAGIASPELLSSSI